MVANKLLQVDKGTILLKLRAKATWVETFIFALVAVIYVVIQLTNSNAIIMSVLFMLSLVALLINKYILDRDIYNLLLFIFISNIQNMAIGLGGSLNPVITNTNYLFLVAFKELFILVGIGVYGLAFVKAYVSGRQKLKFYTFDGIMLMYFLWLFISFVFIRPNISLDLRVSYLRNFSVLFGIYIWLRLMKLRDQADMITFIRYMIGFAVVLCIFGVIEYLFFSDKLWIDVFHAQRLRPNKTIAELLPLWDTQIGSLHLDRMVSIFMQPVNFSYFLVLPLLFAILALINQRKSLWYILSALLLISFILTYSKGGLLILVTISFLYIVFAQLNRRFFVPLAVAVVVGAFAGVMFTNSIVHSSANIHLQGLLSPLISLINAPLGHGIGMGGNLAYQAGVISGSQWLATGGESGIGVISYQLGIPGLGLFVTWFISFAAFLYDQYISVDESAAYKPYARLAPAVVIAILIGALFQESAFGPQATGVFIIFAVIVLQQHAVHYKIYHEGVKSR